MGVVGVRDGRDGRAQETASSRGQGKWGAKAFIGSEHGRLSLRVLHILLPSPKTEREGEGEGKGEGEKRGREIEVLLVENFMDVENLVSLVMRKKPQSWQQKVLGEATARSVHVRVFGRDAPLSTNPL